jgi:hypothetical protein
VAIAERQLETWAQQGKTGQFTDTYKSISGNLLNGGSAPYPVANVEVFLQGSYGNDTNVWADSDVDIVLKHTGAFYHDISQLSKEQQARYENDRSSSVSYGYQNFRAHAEGYIKKLYNGVNVGKKAVFVPGNNSRRNADILVCQQLRRYISYEPGNIKYYEGVAFFSGDKRIDNFPKQHSARLTEKHQATKNNFKPMVRVFKNMRNSLIEKKSLAEGVAPSYFIEGLLSNVPNDKFAGDYQDMWVACFNWIVTADETKLACANDLYWLIRENSAVCWSSANFRAFTAALRKYWES